MPWALLPNLSPAGVTHARCVIMSVSPRITAYHRVSPGSARLGQPDATNRQTGCRRAATRRHDASDALLFPCALYGERQCVIRKQMGMESVAPRTETRWTTAKLYSPFFLFLAGHCFKPKASRFGHTVVVANCSWSAGGGAGRKIAASPRDAVRIHSPHDSDSKRPKSSRLRSFCGIAVRPPRGHAGCIVHAGASPLHQAALAHNEDNARAPHPRAATRNF